MISCIISSANGFFLKQLTDNIEKTIGVPYEIVAIDNSEGKMGICEVYNKGAKKAIYPFLCFVHEDVVFETNNWGSNALLHFENNEDIGVIGVAGCQVKSAVISTWYYPSTKNVEPNRYNYKQVSKKASQVVQVMYMNPHEENFSEVTCLDGVFLFAKKTVWERCQFDEQLLKHFHGYDLDFSLAAARISKLAVVYDIVLLHITDGHTNCKWVVESFKVHKKWKKKLPIFLVQGIDKGEQDRIDIDSFKYAMDLLRKEKGSFWEQIKMLLFFEHSLYRSRSHKERWGIFFREVKISIKTL